MNRLPVREFVVAVAQQGDLPQRLGHRTRPEEGILAQQALAQREGPAYQTEVAVSRRLLLAGKPWQLRGRIDGLRKTQDTLLLDEMKCTRAPAATLHQQSGHLHWAQLECYAALYALSHPNEQSYRLRLRYLHPEQGETACYERLKDRNALLTQLSRWLCQYARRIGQEHRRRRQRDHCLRALSFPMRAFRPNQRALAALTHRGAIEGQSLLLEASTGLGKSLGVLYPALRAAPHAAYERLLYLTARTTGALAAERALKQLKDRRPFRWLSVTARSRCCGDAVPGCQPGHCPRARGYYDRLPTALDSLPPSAALDQEAVRALADRYALCPFELSLDLLPVVDVVIADYNYLFDPEVRLRRFGTLKEWLLLIDEAHQLAPRVSDSLSAEVSLKTLGSEQQRLPRGALKRALSALRTEFNRLLAVAPGPVGHGKAPEASTQRVLDAIEQKIDTLLECTLAFDWQTEFEESMRTLLFDCLRWQSRSHLRTELPYLPLPEAEGTRVRLRCLDAAPFIGPLLRECHGDVRFSGTLRPGALQSALHGHAESAYHCIAGPFDPEQQAVLVVDDIPTYFRQRQHSLPRLVALIEALVAAKGGVYLVAFPSFAYLEAAARILSQRLGAERVLEQTRAMSSASQAEFLNTLRVADAAAETCIGCVVLGGVFAESIDYSELSLAGVVCVSVGLAPPGPEQAAREAYLNATQPALCAQTITRLLPAMVKTVQMAGRLLRSPTDRGVLCLVDDRFKQPAYQQFFPSHWQPERTPLAAVPERVANFWRAD